MRINNGTVLLYGTELQRLKHAVLLYANTAGNIMSLAKMLFRRHLNNMPVVGSLMS